MEIKNYLIGMVIITMMALAVSTIFHGWVAYSGDDVNYSTSWNETINFEKDYINYAGNSTNLTQSSGVGEQIQNLVVSTVNTIGLAFKSLVWGTSLIWNIGNYLGIGMLTWVVRGAITILTILIMFAIIREFQNTSPL